MNAPAEPTSAQQNAARLTAWAVDELPPEAQLAFEASLHDDPARLNEAEQFRAFSRLLESGLKNRLPESARQLPVKARQQLQLEAASRQQAPRRLSLWMPSLATAACFAVMLGVFANSRRPQPAGGQTAQASTPPEEIQRLLRMGAGYFDLGHYAEAEQRFNQVLALNPANPAARSWLERTKREMNSSYRGSDRTRITMLSQMDSLWVTPVPGPPSPSTNDGGLSPWGEEEPHDISGAITRREPYQYPIVDPRRIKGSGNVEGFLSPWGPEPNYQIGPSIARRSDPWVSSYNSDPSAVPSLQSQVPNDVSKTALEGNPLAQLGDKSTTEEVRRLFRMGLGYFDLGQFSDAEKQFNQVLAADPGNSAARRMLEKTEREVNNYYRSARDHTRAKMLNDVDSLWVTPVPGQATPSVPNSTPPNYGQSIVAQEIIIRQKRSTIQLGEGEQHAGDALARDSYSQAIGRMADADGLSAESYRALPENPFLPVLDQPLSTFSIDVDTASYAIARRHLNEGQRPPAESVRLEEMINYFPMDDAPPADGKPFAVHVETASAPWAATHRLVRVALKGKVPATEARRPANLVFLVDTSGSMDQPNKLPLVQQSLRLLLDQLEPRDLVTLVTYAGDSELKLATTPVSERARIAAAIDALTSGGSTNGSGGITTAYQQARAHLVDGGVNRVILATDGDFNVGLTSETDLQTLIAKEAKSGVYLSVLAYGSDNLKDTTAELLADKGNGNYAYIDSLSEARRALVTQLQGTLVTIAKDVKIQVEFNPAQVAQYRLLGYENRALANKDFNDDTKDAGEIGAGHSVTALYEIIPAGMAAPTTTTVDPLKYQTPPPAPVPPPGNLTKQAATGELLTVKLRYQQPEGTAPSQLIEVPVKDPGTAWAQASDNFRWTAAVAGYGMLLRNSAHAGDLTWETIRQLASAAKGPDPDGFRGEFLQLIEKAAGLAGRK